MESTKGICQNCFRNKEIKHVSINQNIGLLITRLTKKVEANLCKECISIFFWPSTLTTIILGWWGVISFIVTPFILIGNTYYYLSSLGMDSKDYTSRQTHTSQIQKQFSSSKNYGKDIPRPLIDKKTDISDNDSDSYDSLEEPKSNDKNVHPSDSDFFDNYPNNS